MRRIDPSKFRVATRGTSREINRSIVLNLVRAQQPISRADLARLMDVRRGAVSLIVNDLLAEGLIFEGATGETVRGRKPTFLYIDSRRRAIVAADVRASETFLMLADRLGKPFTGVISFPTVRDPKDLVETLAGRIKQLLADHKEVDACDGIGVVVPGMVEHSTMRVLHAPTLGWRNVNLRAPPPPVFRFRSRTPDAPVPSPRPGRCARTSPAPLAISSSSASRTVWVWA
jgi:hypothetical protein